ncbi:ATP-binding protein [Paraburkholderia sp. CNPSo 3272]|uniref:ATP-binding protein n=1 Tax=Paraburkholderia sp. CNPSo 3272 TaxID=2940931 RepID=UPI0020B661D5|nr:ATP-binding protein [Paraburkholderia sp. CNPSo 3272]MCP3728653.1 ATP-binding protein [Paraburkholderia sp. CNPSo 3272]
MTTDETPWVSRFTPLLNRERIRELVELRPQTILNIGDMSPQEACERVKDAFQRVYYPSAQCLDILLQWVRIALAHSLKMYETSRMFVEGVYQRESPLPEFSFPWCLTGLAGTGKSALLSAFERLMPKPDTVTAADGTKFPLVSYRAVTVRASSTSRDILMQFARREGSTRVLSDYLRRLAYSDGWALVLQDEFQFATQSARASTRVTQMILAMCYIGVPAVYIANYSLLHKLNERNQEDRHRLLGKVVELYPDNCKSKDYRTLLSWFREIAPEIFTYDPEGDAEAIDILTAGIKRPLVSLMEIGFAMAFSKGGVVDYSVLEKAYKSREYATFRNDVEALAKLYGAFRKSHKDLWCPIDAVLNSDEDLDLERDRQSLVDMKAMKASMTVEERKAYAEVSTRPEATSTKSGEVKLASKRTKKADAEQLRENHSWFSDKL